MLAAPLLSAYLRRAGGQSPVPEVVQVRQLPSSAEACCRTLSNRLDLVTVDPQGRIPMGPALGDGARGDRVALHIELGVLWVSSAAAERWPACRLDARGRLSLPRGVAYEIGLGPGARAVLDAGLDPGRTAVIALSLLRLAA